MKINKHSGNNSGSINKYFLIPCSGIHKIIPTSTPGKKRLITFSGVAAIEIPLTIEKNTYSEKKIEDSMGITYEVSSSGFIAGDSPELANALGNLNDKYVLVYLDQDNNYKLIGNKQEPVNISCSFTTGMTIAALKGSSFSFSRKLISKPTHIQSPQSAGTGWAVYAPPPEGSAEE